MNFVHFFARSHRMNEYMNVHVLYMPICICLCIEIFSLAPSIKSYWTQQRQRQSREKNSHNKTSKFSGVDFRLCTYICDHVYKSSWFFLCTTGISNTHTHMYALKHWKHATLKSNKRVHAISKCMAKKSGSRVNATDKIQWKKIVSEWNGFVSLDIVCV